MEQLTLSNQSAPKGRVLLIILSIVAWALLSLSFLFYAIRIIPQFSFSVYDVLWFTARLIEPLACGALFLFALVFYRNGKAAGLVIVPFVLASVIPLFGCIEYFIDSIRYEYFDILNTVFYLIDLLFVIFAILAGIFACIRSTKKVFIILAVVFGFLSQCTYFYYFCLQAWDWLRYFPDDIQYLMYLIFRLLNIWGSSLLYVAMLILGLNMAKKSAPALTPEQALTLLYERRCREEISAEEYQAQRAEIIRNL
ncbi:MAG: hypothetical protein E7450_01545 [Ruminococcaceae bacterium]|nr:hypothetical protein [Oscillospiraceae bacterium]